MRVKNIAAGFYDAQGFHPIRSSADYDPDRAGDEYSQRKPRAKRRKKPAGRKPKPGARKHAKRSPAVRRVASTLRALGRKRNPIPVKWVTAKVRRLGNDVQVLLFPKGRVAKRRAKTQQAGVRRRRLRRGATARRRR
jgi:hypothetical protein